VALVFTLGSREPGLQAQVLALVCIFFLAIHGLTQPLRRPDSNILQTVLLFCLCAVALSGTPFAARLESAAPSVAASSSVRAVPSTAMVRVVQTVFGVIVPLAAVVWVYVGPPLLRTLGLPVGASRSSSAGKGQLMGF
jgi:hypothetical protein